MNIVTVLQFRYPDSDPTRDWEVRDDGQGQFISVWNLPDPQPTEAELRVIWESKKFRAWNRLRLNAMIDRQTAAAINKAVHPEVATDETLGILRNQMVHILNGDMVATEDFKRLNEIAIAAIEAGAVKKAAL